MTAKLTTEQFIEKAKAVHGAKYDYSLVEYKNNKTKVIINCPIHTTFEQRPNDHLDGRGCPLCGYESKAKVIAAQARQAKAKSEFVSKSQSIHGDKYTYELVDYTHSKIKVNITCPIHGSFDMSPSNHLSGKGCPHCANEEKGWTKSKFKDKCIKNNSGLGILYILGCFNTDKTEVFIKIGITSRSIKKRYDSKTSMPYNYKVLHEITGDPEFIFDLETKLHKKSKNYKYSPLTPFCGSSTECFLADPTYLKKLNTYLNELIPPFNP